MSPIESSPSGAGASTATPAPDAAASNTGLPEEFVLTPELVEDEAIRGDIVLRGAVVLLGALFGWTHLTSPATLVQIRTGQELLQHGMLPPRTDAFFSYTAAERSWVNLSWLGDLWLAAVHAVGGAAGLSIASGLLSGLAYWLMGRTSERHAPTWWNSFCAALAVIATFPLLTSGPTLITVLGLVLTMYLLQRGRTSGQSACWWGLVPTLWVWSNADPRAYLGWMLVGLYALGRRVSTGGAREARPSVQPLLAAVAAAFVHPFPWGVLRSPVTLVREFHPLWREYGGAAAAEYPYLWRPVFAPETTTTIDWHLAAAALLLVLCLACLLLNRRRLDGAELFAVLGLNVWGFAAGVDFAALAVVNAVAAGLNGQRWYQANCRQTYTLDARELLFSRGGRALTVLALFAAAYWSLSGWMTGPAGRRVGLGLSNRLAAEIEGYQRLLGEIGTGEFDDHPFHLTPAQGDVLIWLGRRSFTDSRLLVFGGPGETSLLERQREITAALQSPAQPLETPQAISDWAQSWRAPLDALSVTHVIVPLDDPTGYALWINMASQAISLSSGEVVRFWQPAGVAGPAAVLYRLDGREGTAAAGLAEFLRNRGVSGIVAETFRIDDAEPRVPRGLFPRPPTFYETSWLLPEPVVPNESLTARHYATRLSVAQRSLFETAAYCHQVIRHARRGLADNPNSAESYLLLGDAYAGLWSVEAALAGNRLAVAAAERRFLQAVFAYHHAAICRPLIPQPHTALLGLYLEHSDFDLALQELDRIQELVGAYTLTPRDSPDFSAQQQQAKRVRADLAEKLDRARAAAERSQLGGLPSALAAALQSGAPAYALSLLERDLTQVVDSPELSQQYARLLLLCGRTSEGLDQCERLLRMLEGSPLYAAGGRGLKPLTAMANLGADLYDRATTLWEQYGQEQVRTVLDTYMQTLPGVAMPGEQGDGWALFQIMTAAESLGRWIPDWELARWQLAMNDLESGQNRAAAVKLEQVLEANPATLLRPQIAMYLTMLTGTPVASQLPTAAALEDRPEPARTDRPPSPELPIRP